MLTLPRPRSVLLAAALAAGLATSGCAYDYAGGTAPTYPSGYDSGMGSGQYDQPGDRFSGQDVASVDVFYEELAPYGRWVQSRFGEAFRPDVDRDWRPYVNGRWGEDRLWLSDDPWGWATDHYGRWGFDDAVGWVWVPGTIWAPSWVAWREDDAQDVAGWAPIPPGIAYSVGVGFGTGYGGFGYDNYASWYAPSWVWVPRSYIYTPRFGGRVLSWRDGTRYWRGSRWNYTGGRGWIGNRPGNGYGRPGGGYGRPGYGRPGYGRPGYGNDGRPSQPRPPRPGVGEAIGGGIAGVPPRRPGDDGRPGYGGRRPGYDERQTGDADVQGRRGDDRGRPGYRRGPDSDRAGAGRDGQRRFDGVAAGQRPPRGSGNAAAGVGTLDRGIGQRAGFGTRAAPALAGAAAPPVAARPAQPPVAARPAPPPRAERPAPAARPGRDSGDRSNERPQ